MTETKQEKFERVAKPRIEAATKALNLLQNLGRSEYESTQERREGIISDLELDIAELRRAWHLPQDVYSPIAASDADQTDAIHQEAAPLAAVTKPIAREITRLDDLSNQQLLDRMIACGAILAERRQ